MKNRRGEIATILTIGTLVIIGVAAIASSLGGVKEKRTTQSRAEGCTTGTQTSGSTAQMCSDICSPGTYVSLSQWTTGSTRYCCCKGATPTAKPSATPVPTTGAHSCTSGTQADGTTSQSCSTICSPGTYISLSQWTTGTTRSCCCNGAPAPSAVPSTVPDPGTCASGTKLSGTTSQNCSMVCEAQGGLYISNTQWSEGSVLNCCCRNVVATPLPEGVTPSPALYPQNNSRTPGMACCFRQGDTIRVYAHAAARENNGMNTPCTTASYGTAYGASSWFECPDNTQDYTPSTDYESANTPPAALTCPDVFRDFAPMDLGSTKCFTSGGQSVKYTCQQDGKLSNTTACPNGCNAGETDCLTPCTTCHTVPTRAPTQVVNPAGCVGCHYPSPTQGFWMPTRVPTVRPCLNCHTSGGGVSPAAPFIFQTLTDTVATCTSTMVIDTITYCLTMGQDGKLKLFPMLNH